MSSTTFNVNFAGFNSIDFSNYYTNMDKYRERTKSVQNRQKSTFDLGTIDSNEKIERRILLIMDSNKLLGVQKRRLKNLFIKLQNNEKLDYIADFHSIFYDHAINYK